MVVEVSHTYYKKQLSRSKNRFIGIHTSLITHWLKSLDNSNYPSSFWYQYKYLLFSKNIIYIYIYLIYYLSDKIIIQKIIIHSGEINIHLI